MQANKSRETHSRFMETKKSSEVKVQNYQHIPNGFGKTI